MKNRFCFLLSILCACSSHESLLSLQKPIHSRQCFVVSAGHIEIEAELEKAPLTTPKVIVELFDEDNHPIPLRAPFLNREPIAYVFSGRTFSNDRKQISFLPPDYPVDGGWIPGNAKYGCIEFEDFSPISLTIKHSKWNQPLSGRLVDATSQSFPSQPWSPIAVNSQGLASKQLVTLQAAEKVWNPKGPVQIIIQLEAEDLTGNLPNGDVLAVVKFLSQWREKNPRIHFGVSVNPYLNAVYRSEPLEFSSGKAGTALLSMVAPILLAGAERLIIRMDDFAPTGGNSRFDYVLSSYEDKATFTSLANAHAQFVQQVAAHIPMSVSIAFVPPWYSNFFLSKSPVEGGRYLKELTSLLSKDIPIVWTGPSVRSLWIDNESVEAYRSHVGHHPLMIWDNTLYARAHKDFWLHRKEKLPLCSLLEPYDVQIAESLHTQPIKGPWLLLNTGLDPMNIVQLETAQGYLSNPGNYRPEGILKGLLLERERDELIRLDRGYWDGRDT